MEERLRPTPKERKGVFMNCQAGLCCAVVEIDGLADYAKDPEGALAELFDGGEFQDGDLPTFVLFSGAKRGKSGFPIYSEAFSDFIENEGLGIVRRTSRLKNPNTGNHVTLYIWEVDKKALEKWWDVKNNPPTKVDRDEW